MQMQGAPRRLNERARRRQGRDTCAPASPGDPLGIVAEELPRAEGDAASARRASIEQSAAAIGRVWAACCRDDLHSEGRPAAGGWPGTLSEARARVGRVLVVEIRGRRNQVTITNAERELAARAAYSSARDEWRRHVDPEPP